MLKSLVISSLVCAAAQFAEAANPEGVFEARSFKDAGGKVLPYRLLKPDMYDPAKSYPIVLFFHGAGERGNDNVRQLKNGVGVFARQENRQKFPCFVVVPQCEKDQMWVDTPWTLDSHIQPAKETQPMRLALELLDALKNEFNIDRRRVYAAGVSMGAFGVWDAVTRHPDLFAAAIPCCGGGDEHTASLVTKLPIWAFHGDKDTVVKVSRSRNMVQAVKKSGGEPKYTEYAGVAHDSWTNAFNEPELLPWLFNQERQKAMKVTQMLPGPASPCQ